MVKLKGIGEKQEAMYIVDFSSENSEYLLIPQYH